MKRIIALICGLITLGCIALSGCTDKTSSNSNIGNDSTSQQTPIDYVDTYYRADAGINRAKPIGYLYQNGATPYIVVIPAEANATEQYAANEFATYFRQITGVPISVVTDENRVYNENDTVISIGKTVYQKGADLSYVDYKKLNDDGFITKSFGKVFVLDAASKDGLIYSAYNFLEIYFGLEFLSWRYTYYPDIGNEVVAYETDIVDIPAFAIRDYYSYTAFYEAGGAYLGAKSRNNSSRYSQNDVMDGSYYFTYYCDYNGNPDWFPERMGHTNTHLLAADAYVNGINPTPTYKTNDKGASENWELGYFNEHNDWYAWSPGVRNNSLNYSQEEICYSNGLTWEGEYDETDTDSLVNKMIEICKIMILDERNADATALMLGHGDWEAKCLCDKCQHFYDDYGGGAYNTAICMWINVISEQVTAWMEEEGIDREIKFVIFAYSKSIAAPVIYNDDGTVTPISDKVLLNDNVSVQMAWRYCSYHDLWDESCDFNQEKRNQFRAWTTLASKMEIWDYDCVFYNSLWYLPNLSTMKSQYQYYTTIGVNRVLTQGVPQVGNYYQHYLHQWVSLKLMWNPNRDVNELIAQFNKMYFTEKYAKYVDMYLDIFENHFAMLDATREQGVHICTYRALDNDNPETYSYELLMSLTNLLNKAIQEAEADTSLNEEMKEKILYNLRSVIVTPQYMMLKLGYISDSNKLKAYAADFFNNLDAIDIGDRAMDEAGNGFASWKAALGL